MIYSYIKALVNYGINKAFFEESDKIYITNRILEALKLDDYRENVEAFKGELEDILNGINDYAVENAIIEDSIVYRDLFDTKIMGLMLPRPSEVINKFNTLYNEQGPKAATDDYYRFSCDSDYIRRYRIEKT